MIFMLSKRASQDIKYNYLNGSRNRDTSFFSSSFLLFGAGLSASDVVSAITPSISTCPFRREAPSEVGNVVDFVAILLNGEDKVEQPPGTKRQMGSTITQFFSRHKNCILGFTLTQICLIFQEVAVSDFELTQKCVIPQEAAVLRKEDLTQNCVIENPRPQVEGGLDTKLCHQRIRDCNMQQLAAASLSSLEEAVATI